MERKIKYLVEILFKNVQKFYFAIYASKKHDMNRKPCIGMWNIFKNDLVQIFNFENNQLTVSKKSFFCGDAAGRSEVSFYKKKIIKLLKKEIFQIQI